MARCDIDREDGGLWILACGLELSEAQVVLAEFHGGSHGARRNILNAGWAQSRFSE